jgi:hypothetical protein
VLYAFGVAVQFDDKKKCAEGFDTIAEGKLTPAAKGE